MKTLFLTLAFCFSFSSFAQWAHENYFSYPLRTSDGMVDISSKTYLARGVKQVRLYITSSSGKIDDNFIPVSEGEVFSKKIALRYGPGTYQFQIMTSKTEGKFSQFAVEHSGTFINTFAEALDDIAPSCDIQSAAPQIIELAEKITQGLLTDLEKTRAIHDWVASNIAYDTDAYFNNTIAAKNWDAVSILERGNAICYGYSALTAALNRAVGIKAKVVIGDADVYNVGWTAHAWNEVYVDGRWLVEDVTWDAGGVGADKQFRPKLKHQYFDPTPENFAKDHRPLKR